MWEQTRGQPWLVNALALEMCFSAGMPKGPGAPLAEQDVFEAREALILRRETHLDQLADKLREPLLAGGTPSTASATSNTCAIWDWWLRAALCGCRRFCTGW